MKTVEVRPQPWSYTEWEPADKVAPTSRKSPLWPSDHPSIAPVFTVESFIAPDGFEDCYGTVFVAGQHYGVSAEFLRAATLAEIDHSMKEFPAVFTSYSPTHDLRDVGLEASTI